jgi:hypothetical protein
LGKNYGFLESEQKKDNFASLFSRAQSWLKVSGVTSEMIQSIEVDFLKHVKSFTGEFNVTFLRDADRNFRTTPDRHVFLHAITYFRLHVLNDDYHQGAGLCMSFLLFVLSPPEAIALMTQAANLPKYVPNYWKGVAIASATDGYVFQGILEQEYKDVYEHFGKLSLWPETYVNKWWVALCMNILSIERMLDFYDDFFAEGHLFFFRFGLSLVREYEQDLLELKDVGSIHALLRLDSTATNTSGQVKLVTQSRMDSIMSKSNLSKFDKIITALGIAGQGGKIDQLRISVYDKYLKQRMTQAAEVLQSKHPDCGLCEDGKGKGESRCADCRKYVCDDCRDNNVGGHNDEDHTIKFNFDWEEGEYEDLVR